MVQFLPLAALRPRPEFAAKTAAPPYDVVDVAEARALAVGNAYSFLHVSRPEIDLPDDVDPTDDRVYAAGRDNLRRMVAEGILVADPTPGYLIYRQRLGTRVQTGVVGLASVSEYESGIIARHELTRADKELDRVRHIDALGVHDEPVFLLYPDSEAISTLLGEVTAGEPEVDFFSGDGVHHQLWRVGDADSVEAFGAAFAALPRAYIADGHHRSAAAARVAAQRAGQGGPEVEGFLSVVFGAGDLTLLPYNRAVADLAGASPESLLGRLDDAFEVVPSSTAVEPEHRHDFGLRLADGWYRLRLRPGLVDEDDPVARLDVSVLQKLVLEPLLGIGNPRTDPRISFIGGSRGTAELDRLVDSGTAAVAFSLYPTSVGELMALADAGEVMPPKSTWFEPKLASGLFLHDFSGELDA